MTEEFEPNILAFCCNWCSYAGADLAGVSRFQYPTNIRIIRVMCSGRVEPAFILEALKDGADGILITGCHIGDCHYIDGNRNAEIRINNTMEALKYLGLDGRLRLEWVSASEGARFAEVVKEFTEEIEKLGPSPLKET
jgi:F420-non-reducing hydrogenase iron-sulfur subunit